MCYIFVHLYFQSLLLGCPILNSLTFAVALAAAKPLFFRILMLRSTTVVDEWCKHVHQ